MKQHSKIFFAWAILACVLSSSAGAAIPQKRFALVIGNGSYKAQPLTTAVNDAALIAQTLQSAGFDVVGARDLDQNSLSSAVRNFTGKVANAGAGAVIFVYFSGYGLQLAGQNYLIPIGSDITEAADLPARTSSLSELMRSVSALNPRIAFIVLDAARPGPFVFSGQAGGLAWAQPESNMLIAFSAAPGTLARESAGSYSVYAKALAEMIREGDLTPADLFTRVRLRVHDLTKGAQTPWEFSKVETGFRFLDRAPNSPARSDAPALTSQFRLLPLRALGAQDAYTTALMRDTFDAYTDFVADYWQEPLTKRVRALLAARRESITWQRTCDANQPAGYWSYLERYPLGPHVADANRLLKMMGAATVPPSKFSRMDYDIPPPLPDELEYIERPMLVLDDPAFGFEALPPTTAKFLEPPPQELLKLKPPGFSATRVLPVVDLPLQAYLSLPTDAKVVADADRTTSAMRPAVDIPGGLGKRADPSLISSPSASKSMKDISKEVRSPSSLDEEASRNDKQSVQTTKHEGASERLVRSASPLPEARAANSDLSDQHVDDSSLSAVRPIALTTPRWLADVMTLRRSAPFGQLSAADSVTTSVPSMFASASAGLTFQTWRQEKLTRPALRAPTPAPLAPSQVVLSGQTSHSLPPSTQATGTVPRSVNRSTAVTARASGSPPKPGLGPASTVDQAKPRRKPLQTVPSITTEHQ